MKKIILFFFIFLFFQSVASAYYSLPNASASQTYWGIGVVQVSNKVLLYDKPNSSSRKIFEIEIKDEKYLCNKNECKISPFVGFYPQKKLALLIAEDEQNGWAYVCYNQLAKSFAWVKLDDNTKFFTWSQFINLYGRKYGLYLFKDVKKKDRILFAQPFSGSKSVDMFEYPKRITPWYVSGNFVMVKLLNYDNIQKTGWLRWRTDDGELLLFPNFKN